MPSKLQSILACGQPVLCCAAGDAAGAVKRAQAGWTVAPADPDQLARALQEAYGMSRETLRVMGQSGRDYYVSTLGETANASVLAAVLEGAAVERTGRRD